MANVGYATVSVIPSAEGFSKKLTETVVPAAEEAGEEAGEKGGEKFQESMGEHVAEIGKMLVGMFAINAGVEFFGGAVEAAEALEKQTEALDTIMEHAKLGTADAFKEFNESLLSATGTSQLAAEQIEAAFAKVHGATVPEIESATQATVDMAAALGTDAPTAAAAFSKALVDPANASRILKAAGVELNDEQQKSIDAFTKAGDAAGAQGVIIEAVGGKFEGAAAKMQTPMDKFKATMGELQVNLGDKLLPVIDSIAEKATEALGWMSQHSTLLKTIAEILGPMVGVILSLVAAQKLWTTAVEMFNTIADMNPWFLAIAAIVAVVVLVIKYHTQLADIAKKVWSDITAAASAAWDWLKRNWGTIVEVIGGPIGILVVQVIKHWDDIKNAVVGMWDAIVGAWDSGVSAIEQAWTATVGALTDAWNAVVGAVMDAVHGLESAFDAVVSFFEAIPGVVLGAIEAIPGLMLKGLEAVAYAIGFYIGLWVKEFLAFPGQVEAIFTDLWDWIAQIATAAWDAFVLLIRTEVKLVVGEVEALPGQVEELFTDLWNWAVKAATTAWDALVLLIHTEVKLVVGEVEALPGQVETIFTDLWHTVADIATNLYHDVVNWFTKVGTDAYDAVTSLPGKIEDVFSSLWNSVKTTVSDAIVTVVGYFASLPGKAETALSGLAADVKGVCSDAVNWLESAGEDVINGLINGIKGAWHKVTDLIGDLAGDVAGGFKKALGINSPSRVFMGFGQNTVEGFVQGVTSTQHNAKNVISALANGVASAFGVGDGPVGVSAALAGAGGTGKTLNYYASGSGMSSEEELFAAAGRARMVW